MSEACKWIPRETDRPAFFTIYGTEQNRTELVILPTQPVTVEAPWIQPRTSTQSLWHAATPASHVPCVTSLSHAPRPAHSPCSSLRRARGCGLRGDGCSTCLPNFLPPIPKHAIRRADVCCHVTCAPPRPRVDPFWFLPAFDRFSLFACAPLLHALFCSYPLQFC